MAVAAMQGADHQEQFGVQYLARGHVDMQTRGIEPATVGTSSVMATKLGVF